MARKIKNRSLDTREARSKLKPNPKKPYYAIVQPGVHLGYRKGGIGGTWVERRYVDGKYIVEAIGQADDTSDADGVLIVDYWQAVDKIRDRAKQRTLDAAGVPAGPFTVDDAVDLYCSHLEDTGREDASRTARGKYDTWFKTEIGRRESSKVTTEQFQKLLAKIAKAPARSRGGGARPSDQSEDGVRRRRSTANRTWTAMKAALNHAWRAGKITSDLQWRRVRPFHGVDGVRVDFFTIAELKRLINACPPDFRQLVRAGVYTGGRVAAIAGLRVEDIDLDAGTVRFVTRKGQGIDKVFHCYLSDEGVDFFKMACAGKARGDNVLLKADGTPWGAGEQIRRMTEAVTAAKIGRTLTFHHLRHTWASLLIMNGASLLTIAKNLGHSDTRMVEKHYGHLVASYQRNEIRQRSPSIGLEVSNVVPLG